MKNSFGTQWTRNALVHSGDCLSNISSLSTFSHRSTRGEDVCSPKAIKSSLSALISISLFAALSGCRDDGLDEPVTRDFLQTADPNQFGSFLNASPGVREHETRDIDNVIDFPVAYYNTIDPLESRNTLYKWKIENGFLNHDGSEATCDSRNCCVPQNVITTQCETMTVHVSFRDTKDLGYGRDMYLRQDISSKDVAIYVENYQVDAIAGLPYGPLNLEALVRHDDHWQFGVNAIEFSSYPYGAGEPSASPSPELQTRQFSKFYNFSGRAQADAGTQRMSINLDGRGLKNMPTPCLTCHGGRGRTIVSRGSDGSLQLEPTILGALPGDLMANLQPLSPDSFQYSSAPGHSEQENLAGILAINRAILSSYKQHEDFVNFLYPGNSSSSGYWKPDAAIALLEGKNLPDTYNAEFVPENWVESNIDTVSQSQRETLYQDYVGPNCIVCHSLRGSYLNDRQNFNSFEFFSDYGARIDHLVFERGLMPLGLLAYRELWDLKNPVLMAESLELNDKYAAGLAKKPGRAVARIFAPSRASINTEAGIDTIHVNARSSAFSDNFNWSVSPAPGSMISTGSDMEFVPDEESTYTVGLVVTNENYPEENSTSFDIAIDYESETTGPDFYGPLGVAAIFQNRCSSCHNKSVYPSIPYSADICDPTLSSVERDLVYRGILARVNFASPLDSLIIRKPTDGANDLDPVNHTTTDSYHSVGGQVLAPGSVDLSKIVEWILADAPADNSKYLGTCN